MGVPRSGGPPTSPWWASWHGIRYSNDIGQAPHPHPHIAQPQLYSIRNAQPGHQRLTNALDERINETRYEPTARSTGPGGQEPVRSPAGAWSRRMTTHCDRTRGPIWLTRGGHLARDALRGVSNCHILTLNHNLSSHRQPRGMRNARMVATTSGSVGFGLDARCRC